jgi:hypothetical protein
LHIITFITESLDRTGDKAEAIEARPAWVGGPPLGWQGDLVRKHQRAVVGVPKPVLRVDQGVGGRLKHCFGAARLALKGVGGWSAKRKQSPHVEVARHFGEHSLYPGVQRMGLVLAFVGENSLKVEAGVAQQDKCSCIARSLIARPGMESASAQKLVAGEGWGQSSEEIGHGASDTASSGGQSVLVLSSNDLTKLNHFLRSVTSGMRK